MAFFPSSSWRLSIGHGITYSRQVDVHIDAVHDLAHRAEDGGLAWRPSAAYIERARQ
jgi:hypothetical protein